MIAEDNKYFAVTHNIVSVPWATVPMLSVEDWRRAVISELRSSRYNTHLVALFCVPSPDGGTPSLTAVVADDSNSKLGITRCIPQDDRYPALTPECLSAYRFEREIREVWGVLPEGHPDLRPLRYERPRRVMKGVNDDIGQIEDEDFTLPESDQLNAVGIGPVTGVGRGMARFLFVCEGHLVRRFEAQTGFQHRGIERAFIGGPYKATNYMIEAINGEMPVAHILAYCMTLESLAGVSVSLLSETLRVIALELERVAAHIGDLGAMAEYMGFRQTAFHCAQLRTEVADCIALLCGNRWGHSFIVPGGVRFNWKEELQHLLETRLDSIAERASGTLSLMFETPSISSRLERVGVITPTICSQVPGFVGVTARGSWIARDVRMHHPTGSYRFTMLPASTQIQGDCHARAIVRFVELQQSFEFLQNQISYMSLATTRNNLDALAPEHITVSMTEGSAGEVCHIAVTDEEGHFATYKIIDPSFHNLDALTYAMKNEAISEFPMCCRSFGISFPGHDL